MDQAGKCAFPFVASGGTQERGMSKRELYALAAMHAAIVADTEKRSAEDVARTAFNYADKMITQSTK